MKLRLPRLLRLLCLSLLLLATVAACTPASAVPLLPDAQGFGASSQGGAGGKVLMVTRLDDDPKRPAKGSLRWALKQKGPRIVRFSVAGDIMLQDHIVVREPFLTIDGSLAPGDGVCIRGGSLEFKETHDIIVTRVRIRLGDENVLRKVKAAGLDRPKGSGGLDCVSLNDCQRVLFDHCSLSWSCDEIFGIVRCRDVTVQWCLLSEPLTNPKVHPYGDNHAFCVNASASTLSIHHCLMHRFVMRGPQFECNDMRPKDRYTVRMEAVNNVISGYTQSGSRYSLGVERGSGTAQGKTFEFQFLDNFYIPAEKKARHIDKISKHGEAAKVSVAMRGNVLLEARNDRGPPRLHPLSHKGPMPMVRLTEKDDRDLVERLPEASILAEVEWPLFQSAAPITITSAQKACLQVIRYAGDSSRSDPIDARIRQEVLDMHAGKPARTPKD